MPRLSINPRKLFVNTRSHSYEKLPTTESRSPSPIFRTPIITSWSWKSRLPSSDRWPRPRISLSRALAVFLSTFLIASLLGTVAYTKHRSVQNEKKLEAKKYPWQHYPRLNGYFNGIRTLVPFSDWVPEQGFFKSAESPNPSERLSPKYPTKSKEPPFDPIPFDPYPDFSSAEYLKEFEKVEPCTLDEEGKVAPPDIYAYPGIPQNMSAPILGSYEELGMNPNVCFDRFGRFGPYGYSYSQEEGGLGLSTKSENGGAEKLWQWEKKIDYKNVQWGKAQKNCYEKNRNRFVKNETAPAASTKKKVPRHAYILRTWTGYKYSDYQILSLRAMINELALKSGGEYDVHFLVHVKDNSIPIWTSEAVYNKTIEQNLPKEFWGMATLWSDMQMKLYYPGPFIDNIANPDHSDIHSVFRSAHFSLQWFGQKHPEYDFYWNWEMDLRFSGHYYEFNKQIGEWAKNQPRKGIWERSSRYYIPALHGSWQNFTTLVEEETARSGVKPIWGPVAFENTGMLSSPPESTPPRSYQQDNHEWGVGEEADLITFNPIFDPAKTNWVFREDMSGYDADLPAPPRRSAIITVSRLSKRLMEIMHKETFQFKHHMFPEMWPPTMAFHHGLKAVYVPHAIYMDHNWPLKDLDDTFNHPPKPTSSVFGWGEHNQRGTTFYYNAGFSSALWRRWLGARENGEGGTEAEQAGTGRMCLRPILFHPVKSERGAGD